MSANPYEEATVSSDFRMPPEDADPNRIEWGSIVLCYLMGFIIHLVLMLCFGFLMAILYGASSRRVTGTININILNLVMHVLTVISLVLCVVWLVRRVRSRKLFHAAIFAGVNLAIDVVLAIAYFDSVDWEQFVSLPGQVVVILVTGWLASRWLKKTEVGSQVSTGGV